MGDRTPQNYILIVLLFISTSLFSQQGDYIIGKLFDAKSQEPVVFASIRIKNKALGVISNMDGSFKIPLKYKELGDIIEISSMGYQSKEILITNLSIYEVNIVRLMPAILELEETVVIAKQKRKKIISAKQIVRNAIEAIPQNYPKYPFSYVGYYRDYQVKNKDFINVNEAIIEVFDNGFQTNDNQKTNFKLYQYIKNTNFSRDTLGEKSYDNKNKFIPGAQILSRSGNELLMLRNMNAIRNHKVDIYSYVYRFERDFIINHWFRKNKEVNLGNEYFYSISISKTNPRFLVFGTMYVSKTSFAIYKFDYEVYDRRDGINSTATYETIKKEFSPLFAVRLGYNEYNDLMYPSYISFNNRFKVYTKPKFKIEKLSLDPVEECVAVTFSKEPNRNDVLKVSRYELEYDDDDVRIMYVKQDGRMAKLYFSNQTWKNLEERISTNIAEDEAKLQLRISKIKDIDGNIINTPEEIEFSQFREFFTQQTKSVKNRPFVRSYMNKNIPIFQNQTVEKPVNFEDYWMNTPLQKVN